MVYDDLPDTALLSAAPAQAQRICVGKRLGQHKSSQEDISRLLADMAQQENRVVRLKGGDPFVFGRGGEAARRAEIQPPAIILVGEEGIASLPFSASHSHMDTAPCAI